MSVSLQVKSGIFQSVITQLTIRPEHKNLFNYVKNVSYSHGLSKVGLI
jgi:hypothetical protein